MKQIGDMPVWRKAVDLIIQNGLDKKLPQEDPIMKLAEDHCTWSHIAPRLQNVEHMTIVNSGIQIKAYPTNSSCMHKLHTLIRSIIAKRASDKLFVTSMITHASTGMLKFVIKPKPVVKRNPEEHMGALYIGLQLVIEAIQPYI